MAHRLKDLTDKRKLENFSKCPACQISFSYVENKCSSRSYDRYCKNCDSFYKSNYNPYWYDSFLDTKTPAYKVDNMRNSYMQNLYDDSETKWTPEQIKQNQELKDNFKSSIIPSSEFHEYFCTVMKQELNKNCKCYSLPLGAQDKK